MKMKSKWIRVIIGGVTKYIRYSGGYKGKACTNLATCGLGHYVKDCSCRLHKAG